MDYWVNKRGYIGVSELPFPACGFLYRLFFFQKLAGNTSSPMLRAYSVGLLSGSRVIKSFEELISYLPLNPNHVALVNYVRHTWS